MLRKFGTRLSRIFDDDKMFLVLRKLGRDDQVCERGERVLTGWEGGKLEIVLGGAVVCSLFANKSCFTLIGKYKLGKTL